MKALVFGSLNIDKVYSLAHLPDKRDTLRCNNYELHVGGKGLNQAIALSKVGFEVSMAGAIGTDGIFLKEYLDKNGIDTSLLLTTDGFSGHAVIEVDTEGQNQMILFAGANFSITPDYCDRVLESCAKGDLILMQYETSCVEYMTEKAHRKGLTVALNPSPYVKELQSFPYDKTDILILNESEGMSITGKNDAESAVKALLGRLGGGKVVLTLGGDGAIFADADEYIRIPAFRVNAVDTTGAGDTFTGYFLNAYLNGTDAESSLIRAAAASAIAVTQPGAAQTRPSPVQVDAFLSTRKEN